MSGNEQLRYGDVLLSLTRILAIVRNSCNNRETSSQERTLKTFIEDCRYEVDRKAKNTNIYSGASTYPPTARVPAIQPECEKKDSTRTRAGVLV